MTEAIQITDADLDGADFTADEFFKRMVKAPDAQNEPSENEENTEEDNGEDAEAVEESEREAPEDETDESESDESGDEQSEAEEDEDDDSGSSERTVIDSDDAVVKIKVDGEEVEASIKDLKRLYGQEASLTRKSQEVATIRKAAEEAGAKHVAGLESLLERARQQYEPYSKLNFLALTKDPNISQEELAALSEAAQSAFDNMRFLESELDGVIQTAQKQRHESLVAQAREAHKVLSDPKTGIEGWGEPLYNDIRAFALEQGLDRQFVDELVDPVGIKIMHMAMRYAKAQKAMTTKAPKKIDKAPKRIIKGESAETTEKAKVTNKDAAFKKLQRSGSTDDAADAFYARWTN